MANVDIVFTCTGSPTPILTKTVIDNALALNEKRFRESSRKLIIVDIAVPNDVENDIDYGPAIEIYRIEDVEDYIKDLQNRQQLAIPRARAIIDRLLGEFAYWYNHVKFEPIYNGLGNAFEEIRRQEMESIINMIPENLREDIEKATSKLTNRLLHLKARTSKFKDEE